ncbi:MAG: hypothetical protein KJO39_11715 [Bacteroidia bacterium]|nr:hypothetical protein [Bacteroidia bacterium]
MKTKFTLLLAAILVMLNITCSKDDVPEDNIDLTGSMSAIVNGELIEFQIAERNKWSLYLPGNAGKGCYLNFTEIYGKIYGEHIIVLLFKDMLRVGTYDLPDSAYSDLTNNKSYSQKNYCDGYPDGEVIDCGGSLTITSRDTYRIKGTFWFNARTNKWSCEQTDEYVEVRQGKFDIYRGGNAAYPLCRP